MSFPRARCGRGKTNKLTSNTESWRAQNHTRKEEIGTRVLWPRRGGAWRPWRWEKQRGGEKETNGDSQAIKDGQEARGSHAAALSTPARHRNWTRTRLEDDRSSPSASWLPRVLFTDITELPLAKFPKLLPNFHNNSKISKNKSCSKFKVLQLCFYNHSLIRSTF